MAQSVESVRAPLRQNSTISSTSSGNGTVRARSRSSDGRPRRSSLVKSQGTFLARLTGRGPAAELLSGDGDHLFGDHSSAGTAASSSSSGTDGGNEPPAGWRSPSLAVAADDHPASGPSDYYRVNSPNLSSEAVPKPCQSPTSIGRKRSHTTQKLGVRDGVSATSDLRQASVSSSPGVSSGIFPSLPESPSSRPMSPTHGDHMEYEKRLRDVLSQTNGFRLESAQDERSLRGAHPEEDDEMSLESYPKRREPSERDLEGGSSAIATSSNALDDEEFGGQVSRPVDNQSDEARSVPSSTLRYQANGVVISTNARPRQPGLYPANRTISRLRSHMRSSSNITQSTFASITDRPARPREASHFSQLSRSASYSTVPGLEHVSQPKKVPDDSIELTSRPAFAFQPLRKATRNLYSIEFGKQLAAPGLSSTPIEPIDGSTTDLVNGKGRQYGAPTVLDVRGMIAVGTQGGWVVVHSYGQDILHILGNEILAANSGAVSTVTISQDQTYIAVGHASGDIYLYDLAKSSHKPARTALALPIHQVLSGRKEGHIRGSGIVDITFVGARHTAIVSGDINGRAFWWSLGKVLGVESSDVLRILGGYTDPSPAPHPPSPHDKHASKRQSTLFAVLSLPLGEFRHPSDSFEFSALLTSVKLVIVGIKPAAKTWYRKMRGSSGGSHGGSIGCMSWLRSGELASQSDGPSDPVLAYTWGSVIRFLRLKILYPTSEENMSATPEFVEGGRWDALQPIQAIQWYDENHILAFTSNEIILLDVRTMIDVERTAFQPRVLVTTRLPSRQDSPPSMMSSVCAHRGKVFILTDTALLAGSLLHWNDHILSLVHRGDFLGAIQLGLAYYEGRAKGNLLNLPTDSEARKSVIGARVRQLLRASLDWAFSEDRMKDDTHFSLDGRGVDLTSLFEGLATICVEACLLLGDLDLLFNDAYEHFESGGIQSILLTKLEQPLFASQIRQLPPNIVQAMIGMHEMRGEYDLAETIIWHVDPTLLDINQAVTLCENHGLWDALIYVYTRALKDFATPMFKLIRIIRGVQRDRIERPSLVGNDAVAENAPDAYKIYAFLEHTLSGVSFPNGEPLPESDAVRARADTYDILFRGTAVIGSEPEVGVDDIDYPYLQILLRFDTEALLHAMDIAFEDPYLNDAGTAINRQSIVNLLLDVMNEDYPSNDRTLLYIFVARNLPKYPQFLFVPPSMLDRILISLARDSDQSTREDRQLATEYLLSAYNPRHAEAMMKLFTQAGFFRILRATYRRERKWSQLIATNLMDPETGLEVFQELDEILRLSADNDGNITKSIVNALDQLVDLSVRQTAVLLDRNLPSLHSHTLGFLAFSPHKQMAYLKCLLDPSPLKDDDSGPLGSKPSTQLDIEAKHLFVSLLCQLDPSAVLPFLDARNPDFFDLPRLAAQCQDAKVYEAQLWVLDKMNDTAEAFKTVQIILHDERGDVELALLDGDDGKAHSALTNIASVLKMAVRLCHQHSSSPNIEDLWFGLLDDTVRLVNSVSSLDKNENLQALDVLRSLVQFTLSSLLSSTSPGLSFPRLFKRLVQSTTSSENAPKRSRLYAEFRTILMGMMESFRTESEMLAMSIRLVEADLFGEVERLTNARTAGWRPTALGLCHVCGKEVSASGEKGEAVVVLGSGDLRHRSCHP